MLAEKMGGKKRDKSEIYYFNLPFQSKLYSTRNEDNATECI